MRKILSKAASLAVRIFLDRTLLAGLADADSAPTSGKSETNGSSILEPASGALLGVYYGAGSLTQTSVKLGRTPPVHLTYYRWDADWTGAITKADLAAGRIPLVNWEPHKIDFARIIDGSLDATIKARANGSKGLAKRFFLDFAAGARGSTDENRTKADRCSAWFRYVEFVVIVRKRIRRTPQKT
jgi:hypothetical protein